MSIGKVMRARRLAMGLSMSALAREMGDTISPSWISRYETQESEPSVMTINSLSKVLRLPHDDLMNAFGITTPKQRAEAVERLQALVEVPDEPRGIPVVDAAGRHTGRVVDGHVPPGEEVVAAEVGDRHPLFRGTVIVSTTRRPRTGDAIVAETDGRLVVGTLRRVGNRRAWLETPDGDIEDMSPLGVIIAHG